MTNPVLPMVRPDFIKWLSPDQPDHDPGATIQAGRTMAFGLAMVFWVPVFAPIYYLLGSPRGALMIVCAGLAIMAALASTRWTRSAILTGHLITVSVFTVLLTLATTTGGTGSPSLWWLPTVPIISLVLCGVRSGMAWAAASCLASVGFLLADRAGFQLAPEIDLLHLQLLDAAGTIGITLCAFSLTLVFKLSEDLVRRKLETARFESEQANRTKGIFLANMSHEIRTPMNTVVGMIDLVLDTDLTSQQREYLAVVRHSSDALLALLNDILDFSKIEADKLQLDDQPFDLHAWVADVITALAVPAFQRNIELMYRIHPDVPRIVIGDSHRLRQIAFNLISNAIKFTEFGNVSVDVDCRQLTADRMQLRFEVTDTGIGISAEQQERIFRAFEQADASTTRRYGGTGLGLTICARLVQLMHGHIEVESEEGRGSKFRIDVPLQLDTHSTTPRSIDPPCVREGCKVLIIDDNCRQLQLLSEMFQSWKIDHGVASDARQALAQLRQAFRSGTPYRLLVVDAHMPEIDGFALARRIQELPELGCSILMMLAPHVAKDDILICEQLGITSYLFKPIHPPTMRDALLDLWGQPSNVGRETSLAADDKPPPRPLRVLLVEDSQLNQKYATAVLNKVGHEVVVAGNGRESVESWRKDPFDVILMDIQMPEMDGLQATRVIRSEERSLGRHIPIIAMTAHALSGDRQRCLDAGMDDYITKPIGATQLMASIAAAVASHADDTP